MHKLLKQSKNASFSWSDDCQWAFDRARADLAKKVCTNAVLSRTTDASNYGLRGALQRLNGDDLEPLAFFSKMLCPAQINYSTFDKELLAIFLAIKHFRHFIEGREFFVYTDHRPIAAAIVSKTGKSPRQQRIL